MRSLFPWAFSLLLPGSPSTSMENCENQKQGRQYRLASTLHRLRAGNSSHVPVRDVYHEATAGFPVRCVYNPNAPGYFLGVSSRPIKPGEVVLRTPLLAVKISAFSKSVPHVRTCAYCLRYTHATTLSDGCSACLQHFCSPSCRSAAFAKREAHSTATCVALASLRSGPPVLVEAAEVAVAVILAPSSAQKNIFLSLRACRPAQGSEEENERLEIRKAAERMQIALSRAARAVGEKPQEQSIEFLETVLRRVMRYGMSVDEKRSATRVARWTGRYVAPTLSLFTQSCMPNLAYHLEPTQTQGSSPNLTLEALHYIRENTSLTIALEPPGQPFVTRRAALARCGVRCECKRCEVEEGIERGAGSARKQGKGGASRRKADGAWVSKIAAWDRKHLCVCGRARKVRQPPPPPDFFNILGLVPGTVLSKPRAEDRQRLLDKAYRRSMLREHPDKNRGSNLKEANQKTKLLKKSHEVLTEALEQGRLADYSHPKPIAKRKPTPKPPPANRTKTGRTGYSLGKIAMGGRCRCAERPLSSRRTSHIPRSSAC